MAISRLVTLLLALALLPACAVGNGAVEALPSGQTCFSPGVPESATSATVEFRQTIEHYRVAVNDWQSVEVTHRHDHRTHDFSYRLTAAASGEELAVDGEAQAVALAKAIYRPFANAVDTALEAYLWSATNGTWSFADMTANWRISIAHRDERRVGGHAVLYLDTQRQFAKISDGI